MLLTFITSNGFVCFQKNTGSYVTYVNVSNSKAYIKCGGLSEYVISVVPPEVDHVDAESGGANW